VTFAEESYNIKKGDTVFIHAAAGSFGLLMTQVAKHKGAIVIGSTSTEEKAKLAKANGIDHIIIYTKEDIVKRVLEITNGEGVEAIYDGVGKDTYVIYLSD
jgi:NADPH2:quinone reductase